MCKVSWIAALLVLAQCAAAAHARLLMPPGRAAHANVVVMNMAEFPSTEVALHMPCVESNMFATKCMVSYELELSCGWG